TIQPGLKKVEETAQGVTLWDTFTALNEHTSGVQVIVSASGQKFLMVEVPVKRGANKESYFVLKLISDNINDVSHGISGRTDYSPVSETAGFLAPVFMHGVLDGDTLKLEEVNATTTQRIFAFEVDGVNALGL